MDQCTFYNKVGACRHGDRCVRSHHKPENSTVIVCIGLYDTQRDKDTDKFVEDIFCEAALIAPIHDMLVAGNTAQHLKGNVYLAFSSSREARAVLTNFNRRWYGGRPVFCELSPVRELRGAQCREHPCSRQLECNYVHPVNTRSNRPQSQSYYSSYDGPQSSLQDSQRGRSSQTGHDHSGNAMSVSVEQRRNA